MLPSKASIYQKNQYLCPQNKSISLDMEDINRLKVVLAEKKRTAKYPKRVGTYSYTTNGGMSKTVPVIDGEME